MLKGVFGWISSKVCQMASFISKKVQESANCVRRFFGVAKMVANRSINRIAEMFSSIKSSIFSTVKGVIQQLLKSWLVHKVLYLWSSIKSKIRIARKFVIHKFLKSCIIQKLLQLWSSTHFIVKNSVIQKLLKNWDVQKFLNNWSKMIILDLFEMFLHESIPWWVIPLIRFML